MEGFSDASPPEAAWRCGEPDWTLFHDNRAVWTAVLELCDAARESIDLQQYILAPSGIGQRLLDLLAEKARQGVAVRVLADAFGSHGLRESEGARALLRHGGRIAMFNRGIDVLRNPVARLQRLHSKTLICDGAWLMSGGSCFHDRMADWRDTMIRVGGPLPPAVAAVFERDWRDALRENQHSWTTDAEPEAPATGWAFAASGAPRGPSPDLRETLLGRIAGAGRSVHLTTPYLVPDRALKRALASAVSRGARVTILMPARSDYRLLDVVGRRAARTLARQGVEMREYLPGMLHAKIALVDESWSSVSSFNLDILSAKLNRESGVLSGSSALYGRLAEQIEADLSKSERI